MKLLLIAQEIPYPPIHGARIDTWNRIIGFKESGIEIFLLTWVGIKKFDSPSENDIIAIQDQVDCLELCEIRRGLRRLISLLFYPSPAAGRLFSKTEFDRLFHKVKKFNPDCIFLDGIYPGVLGVRLSELLKIPLFLRKHNIEHRYMMGQVKLASTLKIKLSVLGSTMHLRHFEKFVMSSANYFFDISLADLNYWKAKGFSNGSWLPPVYKPTLKSTNKSELNQSINIFDIVFIGNLNSPNNVTGLKWFIQSVFPKVLECHPGTTVGIMGSYPNGEIIEICSSRKDVTIIANPLNPYDEISEKSILINPVKFGSGVNVKTIDMLFTTNQVVTTTVGVQGLPSEIGDVFFIADTPNDFSNNIVKILSGTIEKNISNRKELQKLFTSTLLNAAMSYIEKYNNSYFRNMNK